MHMAALNQIIRRKLIKLKLFNQHTKFKTPDFNYIGNEDFINLEADIKKIKADFALFKRYSRYIVVGNGGSVSTLSAFWRALGEGRSKKYLTIVSSMEPDYLKLVRQQNTIGETLVIGISKSGDNLSMLEPFLSFEKYSKLIITTPAKGVLGEFAQKTRIPVIEHPPISGRFSGRTTVAYGPAYLLDIDIEKLENSAKDAILEYKKQSSLAFELAQFLYLQEKNGFSQIFMPVYSYFFEGFNDLVTQLVHETVAKNGHGQTILAVSAPESQHHSNQRFFGGAKNMLGIFVTVKKGHNDIKLNIAKNCQDIILRSGTLAILDKLSLNKGLLDEAISTMTDANNQKIPYAHLEIDQLNYESVAQFLVLWQFVVYYLARMHNVNPFDQPQVEKSKKISFQLLNQK